MPKWEREHATAEPETVSGVTGDTAQSQVTAFEVTGDFDAPALVQALHAAGFNARVKE